MSSVWAQLYYEGKDEPVADPTQVYKSVTKPDRQWIIDALKCDGKTSFETDQWLHIISKAVYVALIWAGLVG